MIVAKIPKVKIINTSLGFKNYLLLQLFNFYFNCNQLLLTKIRNNFYGRFKLLEGKV